VASLAYTFARWATALALVALALVFVAPNRAHAATPSFDANNSLVSFSNTVVIGTGAGVGFSHRYTNAITVGGQAIDGIVTVVATTNAGFSKLDGNVSPTNPIDTTMSMNKNGGQVAYRVDFVKSGTDDPVILQNLDINVADIDSLQYAQFSGVQSFSLSANPPTKIVAQTSATDPTIPVGAFRFAETNNVASNDSDQDFWAQVKYNSASSVIVTLGSKKSGTAFFGVQFAAANWTNTPTTVVPTPSTYTLTYNGNGASTGSVPSSSSSSSLFSVVGNTGTLGKPGYIFDGWNTEPDGSGVMYQSTNTIVPTADMTLYAIWLPNYPQMSVAKIQTSVDPTYPASAPANQVTYQVVVLNTGNVPLTNVSVTDPGATLSSCTPTIPVASLVVGGSIVCDYTVTATSTSDITNVAHASSDQIADVSSNTVTTHVNGTNDIQVFKQQTNVTPSEAGETVTFYVWVVNVGSNSQANVTVTDPSATLISCSPSLPATLASGSYARCSYSHVVTQAEVDAGVYSNTAQATTTFFSSGVNSNTVDVLMPRISSLDFTKSQTSAAPGAVGDVITYNILATNTGNTDLTNFSVSDPNADAGSVVCETDLPVTLAPGNQISCTATHTITRADLKAKSVVNTAYASSTQIASQASNTVTTSTETLADTGQQPSNMYVAVGFALIAALGGVVMLLLRRHVRG